MQAVIGHLLRLPANQVVVEVPRLGGGFGGKETQAATPAALAALAAHHTGRLVRVRWNRDQDMMLTGHRHPFLARFKAGFDAEGRLLAARVHLWSNGGWALDLSQAVTDRALFHLDNAYYIPAVEFRGQVAKTHLSSNTAFRGFGGPQGMVVMEEILDRIARRLGLPPEVVRERNLYRGKGETNTTHYGQAIGNNHLQTLWHELKRSSDFACRREAVAQWNAAHPHCKRGLAITPVKFGISFTVTHLNQAGALVLLYQDGTLQVNHSATEMGQGVHTNIAMIAARELGLDPNQVRVMATSTDKVPNTSATAASCGTDLNGAAVKAACETLRGRLAPVAATLLKERIGRRPAAGQLIFAQGQVYCRNRPRSAVSFAEVVRRAYVERISLAATGYYATPGIHWDRVAGRGRPFHYFACGAAVTEVEVDGFTGMMRVRRADLLHDAGDSINEAINRGQVEGGFLQGLGWLTTEELKWDDQGRLLTHSPDTYKIPAVGDMPEVFNVNLLKNAAQKGVIYGSKAVGEPPFMLAISVREAIRDAVAAFGPPAARSGCRCQPPAKPSSWPSKNAGINQPQRTQREKRDASRLPLFPQLRSFINELGHDADGDFHHAAAADTDTHRAGHPLQFFGGGELFFGEMLENGPRLAGAADHAQEPEPLVNPGLQHQRVVPVPARHDQPEGRRLRQRQRQQLLPRLRLHRDLAREKLVIGQRRAVVQDGDLEIQLHCQRRDRLGNVAGAGDPQRASWSDGLDVEPAFGKTRSASEAVTGRARRPAGGRWNSRL